MQISVRISEEEMEIIKKKNIVKFLNFISPIVISASAMKNDGGYNLDITPKEIKLFRNFFKNKFKVNDMMKLKNLIPIYQKLVKILNTKKKK